MTDRKKGRTCDGGCSSWHLSPVTSGDFSAHVLFMQLHYFEEKRDWSQRNKRPSTSSKFDVVTCSLVGILSIPSLGLLFRHIWTVVYVQYERFPRNQRFFFFCTFAGVLVIRPDSGNPPDVVVKVLNILGKWAYLPNAVWVEFIYWRS